MKYHSLILTTMLATLPTAAYAADQGEPQPYSGSGTYTVEKDLDDWTGLTVSGLVGYLMKNDGEQNFEVGPRDYTLDREEKSKWFGTAQLGYDVQVNDSLVLGIEIDGSILNRKTRMSGFFQDVRNPLLLSRDSWTIRTDVEIDHDHHDYDYDHGYEYDHDDYDYDYDDDHDDYDKYTGPLCKNGVKGSGKSVRYFPGRSSCPDSMNWSQQSPSKKLPYLYHHGKQTISVVTSTGYLENYLASASTSINADKKVDYVATLRARLGGLVTPRWLVYATGGLAFGDVQASMNINHNVRYREEELTCATIGCLPAGPGTRVITDSYAVETVSSGRYSGTRYGFAVGAGTEFKLTRNLRLRAEFLHYDLGSKTVRGNAFDVINPANGAISTVTPSSRFDFTGNMIRAGLTLQFGRTAAAPPPPPPPPPVVKKPAPKIVTPGPFIVFFDFDKSDITPEAATILDKVAEGYAATGRFQLVMSSHADRSGSDDYNVALSQRRANSVIGYLEARGVPSERIVSEAFGESRPLVETADGVREPQNRRTELVFRRLRAQPVQQ